MIYSYSTSKIFIALKFMTSILTLRWNPRGCPACLTTIKLKFKNSNFLSARSGSGSHTDSVYSTQGRMATIELEEGLKEPHIDLLTNLLIKERRSVLFVGEGDFSFTVAFAALRRSKLSTDRNPDTWDGIIATRYDPKHKKPKPVYPKVLTICKDSCESYCEECDYADSAERIKVLNKLERTPPPPESSWIMHIDACHFKDHAMELSGEQPEVIWFQCPWDSGSVYYLIHGFLGSASHRVKSGGYACVGITKHTDYVHRYDLKKLLRHDDDDILVRYEFCGTDDKLVERVLTFGYHHQSDKEDADIHTQIWKDHTTLVFKKL